MSRIIEKSDMPDPVLTRRDDRWCLHAPYAYLDPHRQVMIEIPAGFQFDLASVPRWLWWLIAPFELSIVAPLVHDFLYQRGGRIRGWCYTRADVDALFYCIMICEGVAEWRRKAAYRAVRLCGWSCWQRTAPVASLING